MRQKKNIYPLLLDEGWTQEQHPPKREACTHIYIYFLYFNFTSYNTHTLILVNQEVFMLIWKTWHRKEKDNNDEGNVTNLGHILWGIHENVYVDLLSWFCFFRVFADLKVGYILVYTDAFCIDLREEILWWTNFLT